MRGMRSGWLPRMLFVAAIFALLPMLNGPLDAAQSSPGLQLAAAFQLPQLPQIPGLPALTGPPV
jgi:hypothetical protein